MRLFTWNERLTYKATVPCPECGAIGYIDKWENFSTLEGNHWSPLYLCVNVQGCEKAKNHEETFGLNAYYTDEEI